LGIGIENQNSHRREHNIKGKSSAPDAYESIKAEAELVKWFFDQFDAAEKKFAKYLGFKRRRLLIF